MNIAINTRFIIPNKIEGIGKFTLEICKRLPFLLPDHNFYFIFDRQPPTDWFPFPNVTLLNTAPQARHPILWILWFEFALPRLFKKYKIDLFFSPDGFVSLSSKIPNIPVIHDLAYLHFPNHLPFWVRYYYQIFTPKFIHKAQHLLTVSEFVKNDIIQQFKTKQNNISVTQNAPSFPRIKTFEKPNHFLYLGALHPRKNITGLIQAYDLFKKNTHSPLKLVIIGKPAWKTEEIFETLSLSPYQKDIILTGYLPENEIQKYFSSALAFIYISLFEGFGIPVLDAMQSGVPVITSNSTSLKEISGEAAYLVHPENIEEIAESMANLEASPTLRNNLIQKGFLQAEKYSWDNAAKIVRDVIVANLPHD